MNEQTFSFVNSSDDQYILSLTQDGDRFLSAFVLQHPNAILYYQCDDMDDVPMNGRKKVSGISVQKYRSKPILQVVGDGSTSHSHCRQGLCL